MWPAPHMVSPWRAARRSPSATLGVANKLKTIRDTFLICWTLFTLSKNIYLSIGERVRKKVQVRARTCLACGCSRDNGSNPRKALWSSEHHWAWSPWTESQLCPPTQKKKKKSLKYYGNNIFSYNKVWFSKSNPTITPKENTISTIKSQ